MSSFFGVEHGIGSSPVAMSHPAAWAVTLALSDFPTSHWNDLACLSQVVRDVLWADSAALLSGGEDARLVQWSVQPAAGGEETQTVHKPSQRVSTAARRKDQAARRRQSPY